ncbi:hypothetical protein Mal35_16840 [Gimesia maris]|uniref:hypothetical protein n=1 Tax=Gimesia maris TaxID=122 RepID=UPI00118B7E74|nr:hypothetical protein [Gimesia maris]QDT78252.1 hypothetical protein Mal35_16840 [Gimesia maris]
MFRNIIGVTLITVTVLFVGSILLGDKALPMIMSVQNSAQDGLEELIGRYKVKHEAAKIAVKDATKRAATVNRTFQSEMVAIKHLDLSIASAKKDIDDAKLILAQYEDRLEHGLPVMLVSGRRLSPDEVRTRVRRCSHKIELANDKMAFLTSMQSSRQNRLTKLAELRKQAPIELDRLQLSLTFLEEKLAFYQEMKVMVDDNQIAQLQASGIFSTAQEALEDAHLAIDQQLSQFDAIVEATLGSEELAPTDGPSKASDTDLLADIRGILNKDFTQLQ